MKLWLISDTHLGIKNNDAQWLSIFNDYFQKQLIPFFKENVEKDDILIHCGDVFDNRRSIGLNTINVALDIFKQLNDIFSSIKVLTGNHDMYNKNSRDVISLDILRHFDHVQIYTDAVLEVIDNKKCLFVPFFNDPDEERAVIKKYAKGGIDYVFCHSDIAGAVMGVNNYSNSKLESDNYTGIEVYSGHIHYRSSTNNIHYIGTPYAMTRNDFNNDKGVTRLDLGSGETEFFKNEISPIFIRVNYRDIISADNVDDIVRNNYVDVYVNENDVSINDVSKWVDKYRSIAQSVYIKIIEAKKDIINIDTDEKLGIKEYVHKYIDNLDLDDNTRTRVIKYIESVEGYDDL